MLLAISSEISMDIPLILFYTLFILQLTSSVYNLGFDSLQLSYAELVNPSQDVLIICNQALISVFSSMVEDYIYSLGVGLLCPWSQTKIRNGFTMHSFEESLKLFEVLRLHQSWVKPQVSET